MCVCVYDCVCVLVYVAQIGISWFFGDSEPELLPIPICVGSHMTNHYRESNLIRSFVHGGELIAVTLPAGAVMETADTPRFGQRKCYRSDRLGRWVNMLDKPCAPPFCTGNRSETVNLADSVRACVCACMCVCARERARVYVRASSV